MKYFSIMATLVVLATLAVSTWSSTAKADDGKQSLAEEILTESAKLEVKERLWLHRELGASIRSSLLAPDSKWLNKHADLKGDDAGVCVLIEREYYLSDEIPGIDGGGAYWSFTEKSNDYQSDPQIGFEQGRFRSGFAGGNTGVVVQLGVESLSDAEIENIPADLTEVQEYDRETHRRELRELARTFESPEALIGRVYAVRCVNWNRSDTLAVFQVLEIKNARCTLAWKILKRYHQPER